VFDGVRVALLCGLCPNRRVLARLVPHPADPRFAAVEIRAALDRRIAVRERALAAEGLRRRCRKGHAWSIPASDLHEAFRAAVAAGRRDIVAGVDVG
jgi:hypothetical protein